MKSPPVSTYPIAITCMWGVMARAQVWGSPPLLTAALPRADSWENPWQPLKRWCAACDGFFFFSFFLVLHYCAKLY